MRLCIFIITFILPCLCTFWHAIPTQVEMGECFTHIKFAQRYSYRYLKVKVEVQQLELGIIGKLMKWCKQLT